MREIPRHIGVIVDGNRRFANKLSESLIKFAPCSDLRKKIINASLPRACKIASQTPHNVAKTRGT